MSNSTHSDNSVLIVDDHPLYRDALVSLLSDLPLDATVVAVTSAEDGLRLVNKLTQLSLILLDLTLPGLSGVEAVSAFAQAFPSVMMIIISASEDRRDVTASLRLGARAYISKAVTRATIVDTIERALSGKLVKQEWIRVKPKNVCIDQQLLPLSQRQFEILSLLARGCSNRQIAQEVGLAEVTVKQHLTVIFRELDVENRVQALVAIRRLGLH
jgi:DNA-binding NarL/FixJ family response regulator